MTEGGEHPPDEEAPAGRSPVDDTKHIRERLDGGMPHESLRGRHALEAEQADTPPEPVGPLDPSAYCAPADDRPPRPVPTDDRTWTIVPEPDDAEEVVRPEIGHAGAAARVVARPSAVDQDAYDISVRSTTVDLTDGWRLELRSASLRGLSHQHYGRPRQDDHAFRVDEGRFLVAAVTDGVSRGERSAVAAELVAGRICDVVVDHLASREPDEIGWDQVIDEMSDEICERCREIDGAGSASREDVSALMATTVMLAVVDIRSPDHRVPVHVARLGDTSALLLGADGGWTTLLVGKSDGDGPSSSTTAAVPRLPGGQVDHTSAQLEKDAALVLLTDGVGDPLGNGAGEVGARLAEYWREPPTPLQFAAHVDFRRRAFDDDRTALVVWRRTVPPRPARRR